MHHDPRPPGRRPRRRGVPAAAAPVLATALTLAAPAPTPAQAPQAPPGSVVAFVGVHVIPMDRERVLEDRTVIVRDGRIAEIGAADRVAVPEGATRIDARGKYLVPGIAEMHGHLPGPSAPPDLAEDILFLFVANGVTTVRGMQGQPNQFALRDRIERGELIGPTLYLGSPPLAGRSAPDPGTAARRVREFRAAGYDLLKVHEGLALATYDAIAATARELGIRWGGHVADDVGLLHAIRAGQASIDHLDGYVEEIGDDESRIPALAATARQAGTWHVPTMALWETFLGTPVDTLQAYPELRYMPRTMVENWADQVRNMQSGLDSARATRERDLRRRVLEALDDAGAGILLGSDAPQLFSVPGFSLHREMRVMAEAGLTPYRILESGTRNVAAYFDALDRFGTVEVGRRADLILLEANPLEEVGNLRRRAGVMVRGRWIPESEIRQRLDAIAAKRAG